VTPDPNIEAEMIRMNPQDDLQLGVIDHMAGSDVTAVGYLTGPGVFEFPVVYSVVDGRAIHEGCIDMGPADEVAVQAQEIAQRRAVRLTVAFAGSTDGAVRNAPDVHEAGIGLPGDSTFLRNRRRATAPRSSTVSRPPPEPPWRRPRAAPCCRTSSPRETPTRVSAAAWSAAVRGTGRRPRRPATECHVRLTEASRLRTMTPGATTLLSRSAAGRTFALGRERGQFAAMRAMSYEFAGRRRSDGRTRVPRRDAGLQAVGGRRRAHLLSGGGGGPGRVADAALVEGRPAEAFPALT
jgi:hypothetical protein